MVATAILSDPPDAASFTAHVVLGGGVVIPPDQPTVNDGPLVRMNPLVQPVINAGQWTFPPISPVPNLRFTPEDFEKLIGLELDAIEPADIDRIKALTALWLNDHVTNQSIRADGQTLQCEIGHGHYSGALHQWRSIASSAPCVLEQPSGNRQEIIALLASPSRLSGHSPSPINLPIGA